MALSYWNLVKLSGRVWFVAIGVLFCVLIQPVAAEPTSEKNVLVLHNWSSLPASWSLMESTVRAHVPGQINFYVATVENPRFDEETYRESMAETLRRGYGGVKLDVVIAATDPVLRFALRYRDKMFPGVPNVFTDVPYNDSIGDLHGVTGVVSLIGVRETIDLALRLNPDTNTVAIITGLTDWDKHWLSVTHAELAVHKDKVRVVDLIGAAGRETLEKVAQLPLLIWSCFSCGQVTCSTGIDPIEMLAGLRSFWPTYLAWQGLALNRGGVGGGTVTCRKTRC